MWRFNPNVSFISGRAVVSAGLQGFVGQSGPGSIRKTKRAGLVPTLLISMFRGGFRLIDRRAYKPVAVQDQAPAHIGARSLDQSVP